MYNDYWGFKEKPFENTPDPRFFYCSAKHEEALMRLLYAVQERKSSAMLSGECGSGKTLLSRIILNRLMNKEEYKVALVVNPAIPLLELLGEIVYQLGGENPAGERKIDILRRLNEILYSVSQDGKHTVIIIDEAQTISEDSVFDELRLLLNFQVNERFLLTLLLLGQPELREKIEATRQFKQRLALRYHLTTLTEVETKAYIGHRCLVAGKESPPFSDGAYKLIYEYSQGLPREINNICDLSLVIGMGERADSVEERIVGEVIKDFQQVQETVGKSGEK
ncbi:MAG: AAA family ATPase [Candidatus Omnitrophota bacterium]|nr:AAA family ATPase [Candidatus Omnitrophota bacterium]